MAEQFRVFIAEDEAIVREGIRNRLSESGRFVFCGEASDGEIALSEIGELHPDILVTDIKMPFMDGLELAAAVKKSMPWIRIIIISGYDEFSFAKKAISIGVEEYLLKPVSAKQLLEVLERAAKAIEEERTERLKGGEGTLDAEHQKYLVRAAFWEAAVIGSMKTADAYVNAEQLGIRLSRDFYVTAEAELDLKGGEGVPMGARYAEAERLLKDLPYVSFYYKGADRLMLIAHGPTGEEATERIYRAADIVYHGLRQSFGAYLTIGIGRPHERIQGLPAAASEAHEALKLLLGMGRCLIAGIDEMEETHPEDEHEGSGGAFLDILKYAVPEDAEMLTERFIAQSGILKHSLIFGFYRITELLGDVRRLARECRGEEEKLSGKAPEGGEDRFLSSLPELALPGDLSDAFRSDEKTRELIRGIISSAIARKMESPLKDDVIIKAKRYIRENYADPDLSLNRLASHIGMSPNHLSAVFSNRTGGTFIEYLTAVRIGEAVKLAETGTLGATEIAFRVGYEDPRYFRYVFKKLTGGSTKDLADPKK